LDGLTSNVILIQCNFVQALGDSADDSSLPFPDAAAGLLHQIAVTCTRTPSPAVPLGEASDAMSAANRPHPILT